MNSDMPEEDRWLHAKPRTTVCNHEYSDLYFGSGVSKHDINIALVTFYCKKCLKIVTKSYDQSMYKMLEDEE